MAKGYLSIVLHAHLPFVRHPEDPDVLEERWLHEAILGTYLPLIQVFEGLITENIPFRCTVSISAPLICMLTDDLLKQRCAEAIDRIIELAEKEMNRTRSEPYYYRLAEMYFQRFQSLRHTWRCHEGNLVAAFRRLQDAGRVEVITSTATHGYFPLLDRNWAALRAQVHTAADLYERHFGRRPLGMWLGECGYVPGVDELLREAAVRYFFVDTHSVVFADRQPVYGPFAPIYCRSGVAAFARDVDSSRQVWSAKEGYPGDPHYRDFYRDVGFDLPMDYIGPYVHPEGHRIYTGIKYHAITHDRLHDKWVYEPEIARGRAGEHATHFRQARQRQIEGLAAGMDRPPMIVSPFDAELFGHWWYEGPVFLNDLFRQVHFDQDVIETLTPGDYLERYPTNQVATPSASSWGAKGYNEYWLNETNAWIYRHLHAAGERMVDLAHRFPSAEGLTRRALNQAARELLLAQSSDWAFIMKTGTTVSYAERRTNEHIVNFTRIHDELVSRGTVDEAWLREIEGKNNIFPDVDYRLYAT
jgi:1,4-alpha-glucan branching enzyme